MKNLVAGLSFALIAANPAFAQSNIPPRFMPPDSSQTGDAQQVANPYETPSAANGGQGAYTPAPTAGAQDWSPLDAQAAMAAEQQMMGNYPSMERSTGVPLGMIQPAWDKPFNNMSPGQGAPGVVRFGWSPDLVMPVRLRDYMITTVIFPKWEKITDVFLGETQYLEAAIMRGNVIGLRSAHSGIDTTVTALGESGNIYTFYVRAEGYNTKKITDINVFVDAKQERIDDMWQTGTATKKSRMAERDDWAADEMPKLADVERSAGQKSNTESANLSLYPEDPSSTTASPAMPRKQMSFDMRMYEVEPGDRAIAPDYVYSDGVWTYFQYGDRALSTDWPVVYRVVDGVETRVNTRTAGKDGNVLVAEAIGDFVLRNGTRTVCVKRDPGVAGKLAENR